MLADGIDDAVTAKLSDLKQVYVAPASSVAAFGGAAQDLPKIARALGVQILAQGTAKYAGDNLSITIRMNDVMRNQELLAREFTGNKKELLLLEDKIFGAITTALVVQQADDERLRTAARLTRDIRPRSPTRSAA